MALFSGPPAWVSARREHLEFMVQGRINRGRHTDHTAGRHSIRTNQCPPPSPIFTDQMHFLPPNQQCQSTEVSPQVIHNEHFCWTSHTITQIADATSITLLDAHTNKTVSLRANYNNSTRQKQQHLLTNVTGGINKAIYLKLLRQCTNSYRKKTCKPSHSEEHNINSVIIDWLTCGFTSHSTQNRSFWRRSPSQWLVWKNKTWHNKSTNSPIKRNVLQHKINTTTNMGQCLTWWPPCRI